MAKVYVLNYCEDGCDEVTKFLGIFSTKENAKEALNKAVELDQKNRKYTELIMKKKSAVFKYERETQCCEWSYSWYYVWRYEIREYELDKFKIDQPVFYTSFNGTGYYEGGVIWRTLVRL